MEFVFADPNMSPCAYVSGRRFETSERREGGLSIYPGPGYFWYIDFNINGTYTHYQSDFGIGGLYYCDTNGFHMTDSLGNDIRGILEIGNERVGLPYDSNLYIYYYRVEFAGANGTMVLSQ